MARPRLRIAATLEHLRESLWLIPGAMVAVAAAVAAVLSRSTAPAPDLPLESVLLPASADGAVPVLQVVAGSVITVTSVVFSLTVVALQITAGNYSPRALRTFLRESGTQIVLGTFLANFVYTYVVLQNVQSLSEGADARWAPQLAFLGVPVLVLASLIAFVFFIHHVTQAVRVDFILDEVLDEALHTVATVHPEGGLRTTKHPRDIAPDGAATVASIESGFVQAFNADALLHVLQKDDLYVAYRPSVGDHVLKGASIAWVWQLDRGSPRPELVDAIQGAIQIGRERSMDQDVAFAIRQLLDIAVRALSPGVSDPNTAVATIFHLSVVYRSLLHRQVGPLVIKDDSGAPRVTIPYPSFAEYLSIMVQQIGRYGRADRMVVLRLLRELSELRSLAPGHYHPVLDSAIDAVVDEAEKGLDVESDLDLVRSAASDAKEQTFRFRHYTAAG